MFGIISGLLISNTVAVVVKSMNIAFSASNSPALIVGALAFAFGIGTVSGTLPAMQAAKLKPVDALRYE